MLGFMIKENETRTCPATAQRIAIIQGKQQQRAIPIKHANTTQKMAKKTSNARKTTANLYI